MKNKKRLISTIICVVLFAAFIIGIMLTNESMNEPKAVTYQEFLVMVQDKKVDTVTIDLKSGDTFLFTDFNDAIYETENPKYENFKKEMQCLSA